MEVITQMKCRDDGRLDGGMSCWSTIAPKSWRENGRLKHIYKCRVTLREAAASVEGDVVSWYPWDVLETAG